MSLNLKVRGLECTATFPDIGRWKTWKQLCSISVTFPESHVSISGKQLYVYLWYFIVHMNVFDSKRARKYINKKTYENIVFNV